MTEHPPEQALVEEAKKYARGMGVMDPEVRELLSALAEENEALRKELEKLGYDFAAEVTEIRERAAADCARLEGENAKLRTDLDAAIKNWILPALDRVREIADDLLSPAEAEDEQHAHAEHLREAREHQEEKHGE